MNHQDKIYSLSALGELAASHRNEGRKVVLCHGTFDLMHTGHIRHIHGAKKHGDILLVTITADAFVNKGPDRPVFTHQLRAENLAALADVDGVAINFATTSENVLSIVKPDYYVKGNDYQNEADDVTGNIAKERQQVEACGGQLVFTDDIAFSSSHLLNRYFHVFSSETRQFLDELKQQTTLEALFAQMDALSGLKVAVIGEAIVDEYHTVTPMGQIGKGTALACQYQSQEAFAGGSLAVANHVSSFVQDVTLVSLLGDESKGYDSREAFIRGKLAANVTPNFYYMSDAPTIVKRRFVDEQLNKLFEVYLYNEAPDSRLLEADITAWMQQRLPQFDVVIVTDFGNGMLTPRLRQTLCQTARFLTVNTQLNSGNRGYHVIDHYDRADFIALNEPELRLANHNRFGDIESLAENTLLRLNARHLTVTQGKQGVKTFSQQDGQIQTQHIPALSTEVVDRIGAGDAYLSLSSIALAAGLSPLQASFFGSVAAAIDVQVVCNREAVDKTTFKKTLTTLMK